jgi:cytochrome c oxidase assembly protein subunit 15
MMGYVVFLAVIALFVAGWRQQLVGWPRTTNLVLLVAVVQQVVIGIWTLVEVMPIHLAALHQFGAVLLLAAALLHVDALRHQRHAGSRL